MLWLFLNGIANAMAEDRFDVDKLPEGARWLAEIDLPDPRIEPADEYLLRHFYQDLITRCPRARSAVNTPAARPNCVAFARAITSSSTSSLIHRSPLRSTRPPDAYPKGRPRRTLYQLESLQGVELPALPPSRSRCRAR